MFWLPTFVPRWQTCLSILAPLLACCIAHAQDPAPAQANLDWMRGTENHLEMRIQGEVLDVDGQPAQGAAVKASIVDRYSSEPVNVVVDRHRFEMWLPVHRNEWYSVRIQAESKNSQRRASLTLQRPELRDAAMNKPVLSLQPSTRSVTTKVVHNNAPVANAELKVETRDGRGLLYRCDESGSAKVELLNLEKIYSFTAWTNEPLFGGFQFSRMPVREESNDTQTVELFSCRDQKFRLIDGDGKPCSDVEMFLQVATPPPNYNYLGTIDASHMITNKDGEAVFRWFPDWQDVHCYVDLKSDRWVIDGQSKWVDGVFVVRVKPRQLRQKAFGKLVVDEGPRAGYCVYWRSFQGEQEGRGDSFTSVTDQHGNFSADVLPGRTYCVFVSDNRAVSNMIDLIPIPTDGEIATPVVLNLQKPETLDIHVTAGAANRPVTNQAVNIRQTHEYQWMENGQQNGRAARDRYVYTDEFGKASIAVEAGKNAEVSIFNPDWHTTETVTIAAGQPNSIVLHRELDQPRAIIGVVAQDETHPVPTDEITIIAGAVDGKTMGRDELSVRENGVFIIQTKAMSIGALAISKDQSMAGVVIAENPNRILQLSLHPTRALRGRLVDLNGMPIAGRSVLATFHIKREPPNRELEPSFEFEAYRQTVKTNDDGTFTFSGVPNDVHISLSTTVASTRNQSWLDSFILKATEERAVTTYSIKE